MTFHLLPSRIGYKPLQYPWAFDAWRQQYQQIWHPDELNFSQDILSWTTLPQIEKDAVTPILQYFTQADCDVLDGYMNRIMPLIQVPEIKMVYSMFAAVESVHIEAYSRLIDSFGLPDSVYTDFLKIPVMQEKHKVLSTLSVDSVEDCIVTLATYGLFVEGIQLFSSFVLLLKMSDLRGMPSVRSTVAWSSLDEHLHVSLHYRVLQAIISYHNIPISQIQTKLLDMCNIIVKHEKEFLKLVFKKGPLFGIGLQDMYDFIDCLAQQRLSALEISTESRPPHPLMTYLVQSYTTKSRTNFFDRTPTEYARNSATGNWDSAY